MVSVLDCQSRGWGVLIPAKSYIWFEISALLAPLTNSVIMSTLTIHCQWEEETFRDRTGRQPSHAKAKKVKSLTLHTFGCPRDSLRDCSSLFSSLCNMYWVWTLDSNKLYLYRSA